MPLHRKVPHGRTDEVIGYRAQLAEPGEAPELPRFRITDGGVSPTTAYQVIHDELMLDGNARLNLATFVTTWMDPQAKLLMAECADKNMIDKDEYPITAELELRCVNILADLWHAKGADAATGCSTIGSSEACMLGGLALKWRWRERRRSAGLPFDRPNLVMGANVQICWDKFCRYWDVEPRLVSLEQGETHLTAAGAVSACDENTIGVVAVLGSTFDGSYEPVAEIAQALDELASGTSLDVPIHVDAASGGFVAPFLDPDLLWDFRLERVQSINVSGHKFGLVYPGVGWVVWRDKMALPEELVFNVDYLGGSMPTFGLNFSRPGAQIVAQYYNLIRLGREGYTRVQQAGRDTAGWLAGEVGAMGPFVLISEGAGIPAFAFRLHSDVTAYTVFDVSAALRGRGWLVPAYHMPPNRQDEAVLRIVVRGDLNRNLAEQLASDLQRVVHNLESRGAPPGPQPPAAFHH